MYLNFWKRAILTLLGHLEFSPSASDRLNLGTAEQGDFEKQRENPTNNSHFANNTPILWGGPRKSPYIHFFKSISEQIKLIDPPIDPPLFQISGR